MKLLGIAFGLVLAAGVGTAQALNCNMQEYKSIAGVKVVAGSELDELCGPERKGSSCGRDSRYAMANP